MSTTTEATAQTGTPGQTGGSAQGGAPASQTTSGAVQFTPEQQAHIDAIISDRLARQKATIDGQTRAEREKAEREAAETKAREQGEFQKLAESEKERADKAEAKAAETERLTRERLIRTEIKAVATSLGFANPAVAHRLIDASAVTFTDDGDPANVTELLTKLATDEPYLVGGGQAGGPAAIPRTPAPSTVTRDQRIEAEIEARRKTGRYLA